MTKPARQAILRSLHGRLGGICQGCGAKTGVAHLLCRQGWTFDEDNHLLVSPSGQVLFIATIEHLVPRAAGGTDDPKNLTLYCWHCNAATAFLGEREFRCLDV